MISENFATSKHYPILFMRNHNSSYWLRAVQEGPKR
jgi:hypothetical protein